MKENLFLNVGYTTYLQRNKKKKWTSIVWEKIYQYKVLSIIVFTIILCMGLNLYLIYQFINILEGIV